MVLRRAQVIFRTRSEMEGISEGWPSERAAGDCSLPIMDRALRRVLVQILMRSCAKFRATGGPAISAEPQPVLLDEARHLAQHFHMVLEVL